MAKKRAKPAKSSAILNTACMIAKVWRGNRGSTNKYGKCEKKWCDKNDSCIHKKVISGYYCDDEKKESSSSSDDCDEKEEDCCKLLTLTYLYCST